MAGSLAERAERAEPGAAVLVVVRSPSPEGRAVQPTAGAGG